MDDIVQTLFLNMFHGSKLSAMPPKLLSDDGRNILIRPMAYCREDDIASFASIMAYPIIPCNLCGSQENLQRQVIRQMLFDWEKQRVARVEAIFTAIQNVAPSQLADRNLFDFASLKLDRSAERKPYEYESDQFISASRPTDDVEILQVLDFQLMGQGGER